MTPRQIQEKLAQVAEHLPGWTFKPYESNDDDGGHYLRALDKEQSSGCDIFGTFHQTVLDDFDGGSGASFSAFSVWNKLGKIHFDGNYPKDNGNHVGARGWNATKYDEQPPTATAAITRTPEALAADINRRLLVPYLPIYAKCLEAQAERDAMRNSRRAVLSTLQSTWGELEGHGKLESDDETLNAYRQPLMVNIRPTFDGSEVFIKANYMPQALAVRIVKTIADYYK